MGTQMFMHETAHGGCMDTVMDSAQTVHSGSKIPYHTRELNLPSHPRYILLGYVQIFSLAV